jgi:hypothetical protein
MKLANKQINEVMQDMQEDVMMEYKRLLFLHKIKDQGKINMLLLRQAIFNVANSYRPKNPGNQRMLMKVA